MEFLEQVQKDLENNVIVSPVTWRKVLETALELRRENADLKATLTGGAALARADAETSTV